MIKFNLYNILHKCVLTSDNNGGFYSLNKSAIIITKQVSKGKEVFWKVLSPAFMRLTARRINAAVARLAQGLRNEKQKVAKLLMICLELI